MLKLRPLSVSVQRFSPRMLAVMRLVSEGKSNKAVARELSVTESTIKAHVASIMRELGCTNRTQLALLGFCHEQQLLDHAAMLQQRMIVQSRPGAP